MDLVYTECNAHHVRIVQNHRGANLSNLSSWVDLKNILLMLPDWLLVEPIQYVNSK